MISISEPEYVRLLPDGSVLILASADLDTIKERFWARTQGNLPITVVRILEQKHGRFDWDSYDFLFCCVIVLADSLCEELRRRLS